MSEELIEKVAAVISVAGNVNQFTRDRARAVIPIVLEEAAKVAENALAFQTGTETAQAIRSLTKGMNDGQ